MLTRQTAEFRGDGMVWRCRCGAEHRTPDSVLDMAHPGKGHLETTHHCIECGTDMIVVFPMRPCEPSDIAEVFEPIEDAPCLEVPPRRRGRPKKNP